MSTYPICNHESTCFMKFVTTLHLNNNMHTYYVYVHTFIYILSTQVIIRICKMYVRRNNLQKIASIPL